jgi:hydroxyacylglutathione hydrolase
MQEIVNGVYQITGFPRHMINMYLVGDTLIDAGIRSDTAHLLKTLKHHKLTKHVLTHVHPDHQGASHDLCVALNIPLWCSEKEVYAMESGDMSQQIPSNVITQFQYHFWLGDKHPVTGGLSEGDLVNEFTVLETHGHSPGHLSFWRESDRTLIVGDVVRNISFLTLQSGLAEPPQLFTVNVQQNRQAMLKLAELHPKTVLFGHGEPILDGAIFCEFAQQYR